MFPLLTKANILFFCRYARSESSIFRNFGITRGSKENMTTNKRYELRYYAIRNNLMKKGYITETEGKYLTVKGDHAKRNPAPPEEAGVATV